MRGQFKVSLFNFGNCLRPKMEAASWFGPTKQHEASCTLVDRKFANDSLELQQAGDAIKLLGDLVTSWCEIGLKLNPSKRASCKWIPSCWSASLNLHIVFVFHSMVASILIASFTVVLTYPPALSIIAHPHPPSQHLYLKTTLFGSCSSWSINNFLIDFAKIIFNKTW